MRRHSPLFYFFAIALLIILITSDSRSEANQAINSLSSNKIYEINKRSSTTHQVFITKVVLTDDKTAVNLKYFRNPEGWEGVLPDEPEHITLYPPKHKNAFFIENVFNGQKFSLLKIEKGPIYPEIVEMKGDQTLGIELIFERIDRSMKRFHLIEGEEGEWKFINVRLEPPDPDFEDKSIRNHIKNELETMFDKKNLLGPIFIEIIDELNILNTYTPLKISAPPLELEHFILPSGGSYGIFAYNGEKLLYLNYANDNLAKVLSQENIVNNNTISPRNIAEFVIEGKIDERQTHNRIINDIIEVLAYEKPKSIEGRKIPSGYEVDKKKIEKYKNVISAPHWEDKEKTKDLVFYCLTGWMYEVGTLNKFTAKFDKSSSYFTLQKETLEQGIFKKFPNIRY